MVKRWLIVVAIGLLGGVAVWGFVSFAVIRQQSIEADRRRQVKENLRQIGLALHNYNQIYQLPIEADSQPTASQHHESTTSP